MKNVEMDKLTKAYLEHGMISEEMTFFEKFIEGLDADDVQNYIKRISKFSDEYIVKHFKFEEEEIFPLIIRYGNEKERGMVRNLQQDHTKILHKLAQFMEKAASYGDQPTEKQINEIMLSSRTLLEMILVHARKEDTLLFPNL